MHVHMLLYTEKIKRGGWGWGVASAVGAEALSADIAQSIVMRDIGRPYLISLEEKNLMKVLISEDT